MYRNMKNDEFFLLFILYPGELKIQECLKYTQGSDNRRQNMNVIYHKCPTLLMNSFSFGSTDSDRKFRSSKSKVKNGCL